MHLHKYVAGIYLNTQEADTECEPTNLFLLACERSHAFITYHSKKDALSADSVVHHHGEEGCLVNL